MIQLLLLIISTKDIETKASYCANLVYQQQVELTFQGIHFTVADIYPKICPIEATHIYINTIQQ